MSENKEKDQEEQNLNEIGKIELPQIDIKPYIGKTALIETVSIKDGKFNDSTSKYVLITTVPIDSVSGIDITASRIFGLQTDKDGKVGFGENTKLGEFMDKMKCSSLNELRGKEVICQSITKNKKDFLTFN